MMSTKLRWVPDREVNNCSQCQDEFTILRRKHHCRVCGKLFCGECSSFKLLIPTAKLLANPNRTDDVSAPLRTCSLCARSLHHVQEDLRQLLSKAYTDILVERLSPERYLNRPFAYSMQSEIKKATHTLWNFTSDNIVEGRDRIPRDLLFGAKGLAFLTVAKVGFCFTGRMGTGLVIARLGDGTWSAPSAIMMTGMGWGFQAGLECTDVVLILATAGAVDAFSSRAQVCVGTELAVSLGPVGRSAGTDLHAGSEGSSAAFSYAHSKGLFFGISLEASAITARSDVNRAFYGLDVKPAALLSGAIPRPVAAEPLYRALSEVLTTTGQEPGAIFDNGALTVTSVISSTPAAQKPLVDVPVPIHKRSLSETSDLHTAPPTIHPSVGSSSAVVNTSQDAADGPVEAIFLRSSGGSSSSSSNVNNCSYDSGNNAKSNSSERQTSGSTGDLKQQEERPNQNHITNDDDPLTIDSFLENLSADDGDIDYTAAAAIGPATAKLPSSFERVHDNETKDKKVSNQGLQTKSLYEEIRF